MEASEGRRLDLHATQPPELEFSVPEVEESLTAYLSAIGGAVIGLLLTLLVLAIWNGGTLNFTNSSQVDALEAGLSAVSDDLKQVDAGVDSLGGRLAALERESGTVAAMQRDLASLDTSLSVLGRALDDQDIQIVELDRAVADLQVTRRNFDLFVAALTEALSSIEDAAQMGDEGMQGGAPDAGARASQPAPASAPQPSVVPGPEVAADALLVYLFVDENGDGTIGSDENLVAGADVRLTAAGGEELTSSGAPGAAGALFSGLSAGDYTVAVEDLRGYQLASAAALVVRVDPQAETGQVVYFAVETSPAE